MNSSAIFFLLGMLVCPISVIGKVSDVGDVVAKSSWGDGGITGYAIRVVKVQE